MLCTQVVERVRRKAAIYGQDIQGDDTCFVGSKKAMAAIGDCDAQLLPLGCVSPLQYLHNQACNLTLCFGALRLMH